MILGFEEQRLQDAENGGEGRSEITDSIQSSTVLPVLPTSDWMAFSTLPVAQGVRGRLVQTANLLLNHSYVVPTLVALAGVSLTIGYFLGVSTIYPTIMPPEEDHGGDAVEEASDGDLSAITPGLMEPCKMVRCLSRRC